MGWDGMGSCGQTASPGLSAGAGLLRSLLPVDSAQLPAAAREWQFVRSCLGGLSLLSLYRRARPHALVGAAPSLSACPSCLYLPYRSAMPRRRRRRLLPIPLQLPAARNQESRKPISRLPFSSPRAPGFPTPPDWLGFRRAGRSRDGGNGRAVRGYIRRRPCQPWEQHACGRKGRRRRRAPESSYY
jgi:hypothetical protein